MIITFCWLSLVASSGASTADLGFVSSLLSGSF